MKTYFTSDSHFNHINIIKYCKRPFKSIEHMNQEIIRRWNEKVKPNDQVIFLGDFSFNNHTEFISKLNGNIVFIKGNHDRFSKISCLDFELKDGTNLFCCHDPQDSESFITLHGHVHSEYKYKVQKNNRILINVGVDVWDFYPVSLHDIMKLINNEVKNGKNNF